MSTDEHLLVYWAYDPNTLRTYTNFTSIDFRISYGAVKNAPALYENNVHVCCIRKGKERKYGNAHMTFILVQNIYVVLLLYILQII